MVAYKRMKEFHSKRDFSNSDYVRLRVQVCVRFSVSMCKDQKDVLESDKDVHKEE